MKKTLLVLILVFLMATVAMTSCNQKKNEEKGDTPVVENVQNQTPDELGDKQAVIKALSGVKLGDVFDNLDEISAPDADALAKLYREFELQAELADMDGLLARVIVDDGRAYLYGVNEDGEQLVACICKDDGEMVLVFQHQEEFMVQGSPIEYITFEDYAAELDALLHERIDQVQSFAEIFDQIQIPTLTSSLITKNGEWYMLNRDFVKDMIKSYVVGIRTADRSEPDANALAALDEELSKIDIDLGFAVSGEMIRGVKFDVAFTSEEVFVNYDEMGNPIETVVPHNEKIGYELLLTADMTDLDRCAFTYGFDENLLRVDLDVEIDEENVKSLDALIDFTAPEVSISGNLSLNLESLDKLDSKFFDSKFTISVEDQTADIMLLGKTDANGVYQIVLEQAERGQVGAIYVGDAPNAPDEDYFVFELIEHRNEYQAIAEELLVPVYDYHTTNLPESGSGYWRYPKVVYYDEELNMTIDAEIYIGGTYEYNSQYGVTVYTPDLSMSEVENVYVAYGRDYQGTYDYRAEYVNGSYVITPYEAE